MHCWRGQRGPSVSVDAADHSSDLFELVVIAAQSLPVAGWSGILIDLLAGIWIAVSSFPATATTPATLTAATSALAGGWEIVGDVFDDAAVVAVVLADSISRVLLPDG